MHTLTYQPYKFVWLNLYVTTLGAFTSHVKRMRCIIIQSDKATIMPKTLLLCIN